MRHETADAHIHLRAKAGERDLIDRAASLKNMNRTQYILAAALEKAVEDLGAEATLILSDEQYDRFAKMLDNPPAPNAALKRLLSMPAPWEKKVKTAA